MMAKKGERETILYWGTQNWPFLSREWTSQRHALYVQKEVRDSACWIDVLAGKTEVDEVNDAGIIPWNRNTSHEANKEAKKIH